MKKRTLLALALGASLTTANAHNLWIVPSQTQLSGDEAWVTFDAAASNQIFIANHASLDLDKMAAWSPDNQALELQNGVEGRIRSVFDLQLNQPGTYQVLRGGVNIFARAESPDGEPQQRRGWRGSLDDYLTGKYPSDLSADNFMTFVNQVETFVTLGAPTDTVTAPSQYGLDIEYLTHPNDLVVDEVVKFRVMLDGKPAAGIEIEIIEGGSQYRNSNKSLQLTSNENGEISVIWQKSGMYWLHAESEDNHGLTTNGKRRLSYSAVLEVLPD